MKIVTRADQAALCRKHYGRARGHRPSPDTLDKRAKLDALSSDPDPADVERILGPGVLVVCCEECEATQEVAIEFVFDEGMWEESTGHLCESCLKKALALIQEHRTRSGVSS